MSLRFNRYGTYEGLGAKMPQQQQKPITDTTGGAGDTLGKVETTPTNTADDVTAGVSAIKTGMDLYAQFDKGENVSSNSTSTTSSKQSTINTGENVSSKNPLTPDRVSEQSFNKGAIDSLQNHAQSLRNSIGQNEVSINGTVDLNDVINGNAQLTKMSQKDGNLQIRPNDVNTDNGPVGWGGQTWEIPNTYDTMRKVALPIATYALGFNQFSSRDKWLQGGMTLQQIFQGFAGGYTDSQGIWRQNKTVLDNYYISNFVDLVDMTAHWSDRSLYQNALSGINTAVNFIDNFNLQNVLGGQDALNSVRDGMALLNFGNALYQITKNWGDMSDAEKTVATLQTILAGTQAYDGGTAIIKAFSAAGDATAAGGTVAGGVATSVNGGHILADGTVAQEVGTETLKEGAASTLGEQAVHTVGTAAAAALNAYALYNGVQTIHKQWGKGNNEARKSLATALTGSGIAASSIYSFATTGSFLGGPVGTLVGAVVGAVVGTAMGCVNAGKSSQQASRDNWRQAYGNAGVFASTDNGSYAIQLADGRYYDVGVDGKDGYATMINGEKKTWANPNKLTNVSPDRTMQPYDVDYTNDLDYIGNIMLTGMLLPVGGTAASENSREVSQMIGYMTNGVTSNCGREFSLDNWNIMVDNIKSLYAKTGITDKQGMIDSVAYAYFSGKLSLDDYNACRISAELLYNDNGYDLAQNILNNMGRNEPVNASNTPAGGEQ